MKTGKLQIAINYIISCVCNFPLLICYNVEQKTNAMNYDKLMELNPTSYGKMTNSIGQEIEFYEHPTKGDEAPVICVCHELKLAEFSTFYETGDMKAEHGEYEPSFENGVLLIGGFEA